MPSLPIQMICDLFLCLARPERLGSGLFTRRRAKVGGGNASRGRPKRGSMGTRTGTSSPSERVRWWQVGFYFCFVRVR